MGQKNIFSPMNIIYVSSHLFPVLFFSFLSHGPEQEELITQAVLLEPSSFYPEPHRWCSDRPCQISLGAAQNGMCWDGELRSILDASPPECSDPRSGHPESPGPIAPVVQTARALDWDCSKEKVQPKQGVCLGQTFLPLERPQSGLSC